MNIVDTEKWAPVVGKFVLGFGSLEHHTYILLKKHIDPITLKYTSNLPFKTRVKFLRDIFVSNDNNNKYSQRYRACMDSIIELIDMRNLIAHNPLFLVFYEEPEDRVYDEAIGSYKKINELVLYEDLVQAVNKIDSIEHELYSISAESTLEKINFTMNDMNDEAK
ncbi:hypothetical protein [Serratia fonticola]|uniref:hypothetical protein n=1 Tax=Serratia fonticola TaxID=47917 RepID=UPI0021771D13|nr:hypothetical protein [Serratia fonticola]CAI0833206.1 Uncharacterised protein [Serratia fonticola]CAI0957079.1 Uncharacterised protein [Serratia fonticola]